MTIKALARAKRPDSDEYVAQVRDIAELIGKGEWIIGVTEHEKVKLWGVDISSVRRRAAEARRLVQEAFGNTEDLRADVLAQLHGIAGEQRKHEPRTAVAALLGIAQITGIIVTRHVDSRSTHGGKPTTPEERIAEIDRIEAQLADARAQALAELGTVDMPVAHDDTGDPTT